MRFLLIAFAVLTVYKSSYAQSAGHLEDAGRLTSYYADEVAPIIRGKLINNLDLSKPIGRIEYSIASLSFRKEIQGSSAVDKYGNFTIVLDHPIPYQEVRISVGNAYRGIIIAVEEIELVIDLSLVEDFPVQYFGEGVTFQGKDAEINEYVNKFELYKQEKKAFLFQEKVDIIFDISLPTKEKIKRIQKLFKKLAIMEKDFARKFGHEYEWVIRNERIAAMYADIFFLYWGKSMNETLFKECIDFKPRLLSNKSILYYDFLTHYLTTPSRIEEKLLLETTLKAQIPKGESTAFLDRFLREFEKKRDLHNYDVNLYSEGRTHFLTRYEHELRAATFEFQMKKIKKLPKEKALIACALAQPSALSERPLYFQYVEKYFGSPPYIKSIIHASQKEAGALDELNNTIAAYSSSFLQAFDDTISNSKILVDKSTSVEGLFANLNLMADGKGALVRIVNLENDWHQDDGINFDRGFEELDSFGFEHMVLYQAEGQSAEIWKEKVGAFELKGFHIYLDDDHARNLVEHFQIISLPTMLIITEEGRLNIDLLNCTEKIESTAIIQKIKHIEKK